MKAIAIKSILATLVLAGFGSGSVSAATVDVSYCDVNSAIVSCIPFGGQEWAMGGDSDTMVFTPAAIANFKKNMRKHAVGPMYGDRDDDDEPPFPIVGPNGKKPMIDTQWVAADTMVEWIIDWCSSEVRNAEFAGAVGVQHNIFGHRYLRGEDTVIKMHLGVMPGTLHYGEPELYVDVGITEPQGWEQEVRQVIHAMAAHKYEKDLWSHRRGGVADITMQWTIAGALPSNEAVFYTNDGMAHCGGWGRKAWKSVDAFTAYRDYEEWKKRLKPKK